ncbi:MAG: hypothetical protein SFU86_17875 [Pirellulaceae bacterium]|nr:hypothetical protein [Pirellulaceae bacterium]
MATSTEPAPASPLRTRASEMETSRYDQVSGMLIAVLILLGLATLMMFVIWLSSRLVWVTPAVPVRVLEDVGGGGSGDNFAAGEAELEEPLPTEVQDVVEPPPDQTIQSISSVIAAEEVQLEVLEKASSVGRGEGDGTGDGRGKGPGGPGTSDGIPAYERWEVRMSAGNVEEYARQLDFFEVELAVAGGGNPNVEYVTKLASSKPVVRIGNPKDEKRLRFMHRSGELRQADRQLVAKAGLNPAGRVVFQFYPQKTYTQLLTLENDRMGARRIKDVRKTIFGVRGSAGRYEFYVIDQQYVGGA